ncbi:probable cytochrome P450 313a4 [Chironomus tepperi]|uniref:probable cytochrome P450 313a4 n=1 Tax=Chironomus tepperi TaxID=113505 RepID=UPI00391F3D9D
MIIAEFLIFLIVILVAKHFWDNRRFYYLAYKIPVGNFDYSLKGLYQILTADSKKIFHIAHEAFNGNEVCTRAWIGPSLFIGVVKPEDVKKVLNSKDCIDKPFVIKFANILKGSLFGDLNYWHSHRKLLNPYFGAKSLLNIIPIFNEKVKILMDNFKKLEGKGDFNAFSSMTALTLETILKVMDYEVDIQNQKSEIKNALIENLEKFLEIITVRIFQPWLHLDFIFNFTKRNKKQDEFLTDIGEVFTKNVIKNAKNIQKQEENNNEKSKSFIHELMSPKYNFSDEEIHDEVTTVMLAAQDTSAIASSTTLVLLGKHKDIQQKVVDELHGIFGKTLVAPYLDFEKIGELHYLDMVINETMRLVPVVPYVLRVNSTEIEISEGYVLPAKTFIIIPILRIHRSKKIWGEDADEFRPERFEKENFEKIPSYAYIPFAKGPRMCIGWRYAMLLMKIQLANILLRYEIDSDMKLEEVDFHLHITMNSAQGYNIRIKERIVD